jgi:hypothetical protein
MSAFIFESVPTDRCTATYPLSVCLSMINSSRSAPWTALVPAAVALIVVALCWTFSIYWGPEWPTDLIKPYFSSRPNKYARPASVLMLRGGAFSIPGAASPDRGESIDQVVSRDVGIPCAGIVAQLGHILEPQSVSRMDDSPAFPFR